MNVSGSERFSPHYWDEAVRVLERWQREAEQSNHPFIRDRFERGLGEALAEARTLRDEASRRQGEQKT